MATVFTIGEALIDFIPNETGIELKDVSGFQKAAGGAPANVACTVAKLGGKSAFIGKLGQDAFGDFLIETMTSVGVETGYVCRTDKANTALAFVSLKADGNRDFSFYRKPSADMLLAQEDIEEQWFQAGDILHLCSVDLIEAPVKYAHMKAIQAVQENGGIVSFDPNVRLPLWNSEVECRRTIQQFIPFSHILKISEEELLFITGIEDVEEAVTSLFTGHVEHILFTKGAEGAVWYTKTDRVSVAGYRVQAVDTTGAGDSFIGAVLFQLSKENSKIDEITHEQIKKFLSFANSAAAITTTRYGAIPSLPSIEEVSQFLSD
ncbi:PfkB family carbohydrate kinase [Paenibacillus whitsoniae]|uniref:Carbohydrate kinase n=1 Tax=Paenibacillus whitsoniae TaxID=2496558 RepID=A0A3S0CBG9_9BACL|nr:PfkB family carbohydrate kinase [Paenibacillus whitsoniae]RTE09156.1 carbohydrate kinase [Paenibacillus whitsoniae]